MTKVFSVKMTKTNVKRLILLSIILLAAFLRFYKLDWGEGHFFHPDEYHITISVNQLSFPDQMNPNLFSYGSFVVYINYFTRAVFGHDLSPFLVGRFYSAAFSTLTVYLTFLIGRLIFRKKINAYLSALLVALLPGLIQQAHFSAPESSLTFFLTLILYLWLKYSKENKLRFLILSELSLGLATATKVVALTFLPILIIAPFLDKFFKKTLNIKTVLLSLKEAVLSVLVASIAFLATFPYAIIDWSHFKNSFLYESGLGRGEQIVFYTRLFQNTKPYLFQFTKIFPFTLGWAVFILGLAGMAIIAFEIARSLFKKDAHAARLTLVLLSFLAYFIPMGSLYLKWTRFMHPTFVFFPLFAIYFTDFLENKVFNERKWLVNALFKTPLIACTLVWSVVFFSVYLEKDVRLTATDWVDENIPKDSYILTETGNTLEVPLKGTYQKNAFDFYNLEKSDTIQRQLAEELTRADIFIVQSRRLFYNHLRLSQKYPITAGFYGALASENMGFKMIKEFTSYPNLQLGKWSVVVPDEWAEETWSVFDHPVIRVYKKTKQLKISDYEEILGI
ncbi:MAG: phospholipid carrier-dependent glycosyltransferase [Candidatus Woesebacteria bacterium]